MSSIEFDNVCVDFPIYNSSDRSLKNSLMQVATGGKLGADDQGRVIVRALESLNFKFSKGDRVGILGHNGAGKSTLLRVLSGVYEPTSGIRRIKGDVRSLIDISLGIEPELTGRENVFIRAALLDIPKSDIRQNIQGIIDFSDLGDFFDMPVRTYSTGMILRLAFAVSTLFKPEILIMDEWLSVGDAAFTEKAEKRLQSLIDDASILILASHSRDLLLKTCNRVLCLEHGKIILDGPADEVVDKYFNKN